MIPRLVPEILPLDAFCDRGAAVAVAGIGDSRSWIKKIFWIYEIYLYIYNILHAFEVCIVAWLQPTLHMHLALECFLVSYKQKYWNVFQWFETLAYSALLMFALKKFIRHGCSSWAFLSKTSPQAKRHKPSLLFTSLTILTFITR